MRAKSEQIRPYSSAYGRFSNRGNDGLAGVSAGKKKTGKKKTRAGPPVDSREKERKENGKAVAI